MYHGRTRSKIEISEISPVEWHQCHLKYILGIKFLRYCDMGPEDRNSGARGDVNC
jgi:hypothetical protein